jgi:diacylglycerol kinase (ATP)
MRIGLVCNPSAGGGKSAGAGQAARSRLKERGHDVHFALTSAPGDGIDLARDLARECDAIVVVGGDGSVNEAANGLGESGVPLGIIPAGTVNLLAAELALPFAVDRACDIISAGRTTPLDMGVADGRYFLLMAGAGIDALTIRELDSDAKRQFKELAFVWTGLRAFGRHRPPAFKVIVDGHEARATFAVLSNCRAYAGHWFGITPDADPTDGLLDAVLFDGSGWVPNASFWMGVPLKLHLRRADVTYVQGSRFELELLDAEDEVWLQTDGEIAGRLPLRVEVRSRALQIFVP